jgi:low temperature requirement protein LtrA
MMHRCPCTLYYRAIPFAFLLSASLYFVFFHFSLRRASRFIARCVDADRRGRIALVLGHLN